jgi:O-antigen ligase
MNSVGNSGLWNCLWRKGPHVWLLFLLPFYPSLLLPFLLLGIFLLSFSQEKKASNRELPRSLVFALIFSAAGFLFSTLSLLWSANKEAAWGSLETNLSFLLLPLVFWRYFGAGRFPFSLHQMDGYVAGNLLVFGVCLIRASFRAISFGGAVFVNDLGFERNVFTYAEFSQFLMHPGYLTLFTGVSVLYLLVQVIPNKMWASWKANAALVVLFLFMFMLQGRMPLLAVLLTAFAFGAVHLAKSWDKRMAMRALVGLGMASGLMFLLPRHFYQRYLAMPDFNYEISAPVSDFNSATMRLAEWKCALKAIQEAPFVGAGLGDRTQKLLDAYALEGFQVGMDFRYNAHNQFLETMLSTGALGLVLLLGMLASYGAYFYNARDRMALAILILFILSMLTESLFERAWAVVLFNVLIPVLAFGGSFSHKNESVHAQNQVSHQGHL